MQDRQTLQAVLDNVVNTSDPFTKSYPFYVLIECSGANAGHDGLKQDMFLQEVLGKYADDGIMPNDLSQFSQIWKLREAAAYGINKIGYCFSYDISLNHRYYYRIVEEIREKVGTLGITFGFGHLGDCNLHLFVAITDINNKEEVHHILEENLFSKLKEWKASVSAEHGIGLQKVDKLHISRNQNEIKIMKQLKAIFDPNRILNPYKVLPND